jgi:hypothetical protein
MLVISCETSQKSTSNELKLEAMLDSEDESGIDNSDDIYCEDLTECNNEESVAKRSGVVTILLALGDMANGRVVIPTESAQIMALDAVQYASPVEQPRILLVKDFNHHGESPYDTEYIMNVLLSEYYEVDLINDTSAGLSLSDFEGYDLVWFNNPGYPMGSKKTMQSLLDFTGGVVLSGDDLARGNGFSTESLTGLKFHDNGVSAVCNGRYYGHDNNYTNGSRYKVEITSDLFYDINDPLRFFEYGNDIDITSVSTSRSNIEVLVSAEGSCNSDMPVVVRYEKEETASLD